MSQSWSDQDRKDLRRAQADLETCREKIKELRAAKDKALEALKQEHAALVNHKVQRLTLAELNNIILEMTSN